MKFVKFQEKLKVDQKDEEVMGMDISVVIIPLFCRVAQRATFSYRGKFNHRDFTSSFIEMEPIDSNILDNIFDDFSISLIGCDPHTQYKSGDDNEKL